MGSEGYAHRELRNMGWDLHVNIHLGPASRATRGRKSGLILHLSLHPTR